MIGEHLETTDRALAAVSYILGILAVFVFLLAGGRQFVRFHAAQAAGLGLVILVFWIAYGLLLYPWTPAFMDRALQIFIFAINVALAVRAWQGHREMLPVLGEIARSLEG